MKLDRYTKILCALQNKTYLNPRSQTTKITTTSTQSSSSKIDSHNDLGF